MNMNVWEKTGMHISFIENPMVEIQISYQLQCDRQGAYHFTVPLIVGSVKTHSNVVFNRVAVALKQSRLHARRRGSYTPKIEVYSLR